MFEHSRTWFFLLVAVAVSTDAGAQDRSRFLKWAGQDGSALIRQIGPSAPAYVILGAGFVLPSSQIDAPILERVQRGYTGNTRSYLDWTNELGGPKAVLPVAGIFGASLLTNDTRLQDASFTSLESLAYAGTLTFGAKLLFGRHRPSDASVTSIFEPFSGNSSFPSGHSAAAFAIVTPWVLYYRDETPLAYALFALPAGTAVARIARNKHWPTDVVAGSAIGFFTARFLTRRHMSAFGGSSSAPRNRVAVAPTTVFGEPGLSLKVSLN